MLMDSSRQERSDEAVASFYGVKWITFDGASIPVIMQNQNGCCPLLALANVLLLRRKISLQSGAEIVDASELLNKLSAYLFDTCRDDWNEADRINWQHNADDVLEHAFPKLQTGLDVNVRFSAPDAFEYTPELIVFEMLNVRLYHGWLVDPQDSLTHQAIGNRSYNNLLEYVIQHLHERDSASHSAPNPSEAQNEENRKTTPDIQEAQNSPEQPEQASKAPDENYEKALTAHSFLENNASQLTVYGLARLAETVSEGELCVFFRNNHFATLTKRNRILYLLATDAGYLNESNVVWETLENVEGNSTYVDGNFRLCGGAHTGQSSAWNTHQQEDADRQLALAMQQEEETSGARAAQNRSTAIAQVPPRDQDPAENRSPNATGTASARGAPSSTRNAPPPARTTQPQAAEARRSDTVTASTSSSQRSNDESSCIIL